MPVIAAPVDADPSGASAYAAVKRRVREAGLLEKEPWFYARSIAAKIAVLIACLVIFALFRNPWVQAANAVVLAIVFGQLGFQLHDAGHRQMFAEGWKNVVVGLMTGNLLLGMSHGWWVDKHNRHHANPNHVDMDPDIHMIAIAYSPSQALERRGLPRMIARHQAYFFFPLLFLLGWSMHASSLRFLLGEGSRHRRTEFALLAAHLLLYVGLPFYFLGPWSALLVIVIHQCCAGFYMALVFAPNHKGMPQVDDDSGLDFLRRQVLTSRNVRSHPLTDLWYGALNYQIEHHLFPTMSRNRVREAHLIVRAFCEERGIPYHEVSMLQSYRELLSFLHEVGAPLRARALAEQPVPGRS
ncbi:MAG: acyl-CoA desaturase [Candidatus Dormibacteraeota bacterium]|nr:acyl-CoA desaturase [Candidatus Dormibacteraeota bacterium]